jgi:hypothetical protein
VARNMDGCGSPGKGAPMVDLAVQGRETWRVSGGRGRKRERGGGGGGVGRGLGWRRWRLRRDGRGWCRRAEPCTIRRGVDAYNTNIISSRDNGYIQSSHMRSSKSVIIMATFNHHICAARRSENKQACTCRVQTVF